MRLSLPASCGISFLRLRSYSGTGMDRAVSGVDRAVGASTAAGASADYQRNIGSETCRRAYLAGDHAVLIAAGPRLGFDDRTGSLYPDRREVLLAVREGENVRAATALDAEARGWDAVPRT